MLIRIFLLSILSCVSTKAECSQEAKHDRSINVSGTSPFGMIEPINGWVPYATTFNIDKILAFRKELLLAITSGTFDGHKNAMENSLNLLAPHKGEDEAYCGTPYQRSSCANGLAAVRYHTKGEFVCEEFIFFSVGAIASSSLFRLSGSNITLLKMSEGMAFSRDKIDTFISVRSTTERCENLLFLEK